MARIAVVILVVLVAVVLAATRVSRRRRAREARRGAWGSQPAPREIDPHADECARYALAEQPDRAQLDDRTWSDLNLDAVLAGIDRTQLTLGRQILYDRLRTGTDDDSSARIERLASLFAADASVRGRAQDVLGGIEPTTGQAYWRVMGAGAITTQGWYRVFPVLAVATLAAIVAIAWWPPALVVLVGLLFVNAWMRAATNARTAGFLGAFRQVGPVLRTARALDDIDAIRAAAKDDDLRSRFTELHGIARIARWVGRDPLSSGELVVAFQETINLLLLLDANALLFGARSLARHRHALARASAWVGEVDVALTIASLRAEPRPWCVPDRLSANATTEITGAWHPMLAAPVANAVTLKPGTGVIITGSNMSGKSTYLRTVGVCVVLANGINMCPARGYSGPKLSVRSCIGRSDDLASGKSYYLAEVEAVLSILRSSREGTAHVFLFDELFRGTNTVERLAAGESVLRALLDPVDGRRASSVMVATHDGELVSLLADCYAPYHFRETIQPDGLSFDFALREGPATTRSAIALLELNGAPAELVAAARERAVKLDAEAPT